MQLRYSNRVRKAVQKAAIVISASSESQESLKKYFKIESPLLNETGCYPKEISTIDKSQKETLDLLWVGKLDFRKQLSLAIRTIADMNNRHIRLHIVGGGDATSYKVLADSLHISEQCIWHGVVTHDEVQKIMQESDLFFFTSVAEGTPHVVLEAIGNNLPVICFDVCGQGDSVNEKVGVKIPLSNPKQSIKDFSKSIKQLYHHKELLKEMSFNCKERQEVLSWDNKAKQMIELYERATC